MSLPDVAKCVKCGRGFVTLPANGDWFDRFFPQGTMYSEIKSGNAKDADEFFQRALKLDPDDAPSLIKPPGRRAAWMRAEDLNAHVYKVRTALEQSILQGAAPGSGWSRIELPRAELGEPMDPQTAFEPYRRYLNAHQRQMAAVISTLRQQVRGQVSKLPALQALAALDAQFESILNDRETMWLGKVTPMLEKRFHQALKQHLKNQTEAPAQATTLRASNAPDWLTPMRQQLQNALLAELDTRLQPTLGLLEAFNPENPS